MQFIGRLLSTSALELGLDIGEVGLVVLLTTPPSTKAFWQRVGRAGRRQQGECLLLDTASSVLTTPDGLNAYLKRYIEPNWLYLKNKYLQYTNALCAAQERAEAGKLYDVSVFATLPEPFSTFFNEEINPTQMVPQDLFALKQRAQGTTPQYEFPLRSGIEPNFKVEGRHTSLGTISFPQLLREAYPGAIYRYMARPFRIISVNNRTREILASPEASYTTKPISQVMVFPDLVTGLHRLMTGESSFVAEAEMQVSERVVGFKEKRGFSETTHAYAVGSPYAQRPLTRFIKTTGVCWYFPEDLVMSDAVAARILETFCRQFAIQPREIGMGRFQSNQSPIGVGPVKGVCIFDGTHGSLRLTERLGENFKEVVSIARDVTDAEIVDGRPSPLRIALGIFEGLTRFLQTKIEGFRQLQQTSPEGDAWLEVVAPGETALHITGTDAIEVRVKGYLYTPQGLKYHLHDREVRWIVEGSSIHPRPGLTRVSVYNPSTGEEKERPA
jgi:DEAD/DEAH box helicase domain-containing protein